MFDPRVFVLSYFVPSLACIVTSSLSASGTIPPTTPLITFILSSLYILLNNLIVIYIISCLYDRLISSLTDLIVNYRLKEEAEITYLLDLIPTFPKNITHLSYISTWFVSLFLLVVGYYISLVPSPISHKTIVLLLILVPAFFTPTPNRAYAKLNELFARGNFTWKSPILIDLLPSFTLFFVTILSSKKGIHWLVLILMFFVCFTLLPTLSDNSWVKR